MRELSGTSGHTSVYSWSFLSWSFSSAQFTATTQDYNILLFGMIFMFYGNYQLHPWKDILQEEVSEEKNSPDIDIEMGEVTGIEKGDEEESYL